MVNHCLVLVSAAFLANYLTHDLLDKNNYCLTANLCLNYVVLGLILDTTKRLSISICLPSLGLAYISTHLLSLDVQSMLCVSVLALMSNWMYYNLVYKSGQLLSKSFSLGELLVVSQLGVSYLSTSVACLLTQLFGPTNSHLFCSKHMPTLVLQIIFIGISLIVFSPIILKRFRIYSKVSDLISMFVIIFSIYSILFSILHTNPIQWLINYMFYNQNRIQLLMLWLIITLITLVFTTYYSMAITSKASTRTRKIFHIFISIVYLIGFKNDIQFLSFSSAAVLAIFLLIEVLRVRQIPPFYDTIESVFDKFRDQKDSGFLTLTHIYLLIGCSLPLWLSASNGISIASGVISVGLGDTAAAVGGSLYGRHAWKSSQKTYEGTFFSFITQLISSILIMAYILPHYWLNTYLVLKLTLVSLISALIESKVTEIDNLILPLYHYILVTIFI